MEGNEKVLFILFYNSKIRVIEILKIIQYSKKYVCFKYNYCTMAMKDAAFNS